MRTDWKLWAGLALVLVASVHARSQSAVREQPSNIRRNADPVYQELRHVGFSGEVVSVSNFVLKRDTGTFVFRAGTFYLLQPVAGRITGAVFVGEGEFSLRPTLPWERRSLALLTRQEEMNERFGTVVLRFTDGTAAEIKAAATVAQPAAIGSPQSALNDSQNDCRKKLRYNLDARILQDVLRDQRGGLFVAFIRGKHYSGNMLFTIDPHGAPLVAPEEVSLRTYDETKHGIWAASHLASEYASGEAKGTQRNAVLDIEHQVLDTHVDKSGFVRGRGITTFAANFEGVRVVPFQLFHTLRVQQVTDAQGQALSFIQEDKEDEDSHFWLILPKPLAAGEKFTLQTVYQGKDAIQNEGNGNYFPIARHNWYPNSSFGDYATYDLTFAVPKKLKMVATGTLLKEFEEGDEAITVWKSEVPQAVAGFNFGRFRKHEARLEKLGYVVESYANEDPPSFVQQIMAVAKGVVPGQSRLPEGAMLESLTTTSMMDKPLAEAQIALVLYSDYFGPAPYKRLAMTQQTACNFGQAWPAMVYLPICSFFDDTVKHQLGLRDFRGYWRVVAPHEVAHQWFGHLVGFNSYRDQWISEGFADFAASLFIQLVWKRNQDFLNFWKDERELVTEKNRDGHRAIEAAPVIMGYRAANTRIGLDIPRRLIYPKGAYILHMLRMMMWEAKTGDADFQKLMRDFVSTYSNQPASTEDFKAVVERHMKPTMDLLRNHRMDWFFDEFVYGTALPSYKLEYSITPQADGFRLKFKATQSGVDEQFVMLVPLYLELADGRVIMLGRVLLRGNNSTNEEVPLSGLKQAPKRAMLNYFYDVLAAD